MPPADSWLEITVHVPSLLVPVLMLLLTGLIVGAVLWVRHVRKRIAALSREAQGSREQSAHEGYLRFIRNVSHEIANPLQSIQTNLDNMGNCPIEEAQRWRQYHAIVLGEVRRLVRMTENLRTLTQLESPQSQVVRQSVNLMAVAQDVVMAMGDVAEARGVELQCVGSGQPARVLGNRDRLRQVLMNLVDNGIKYSRKEGGRVIISLREEGGCLRVRVSDEGVGIPQDDLPYVFNIAYRALDASNLRRKGTGLGLAIAKRIVEEHGGEIEARSKPGEGTTIAFSLPLYFPSQEADP